MFCFKGYVELVQLIITKRKTDLSLNEKIENTFLLIIASQNGHGEVVKILLEKRAQVDLQEQDGVSALIAASYNRHYEVVKILPENGAQVDLLPEQNDHSALMFASQTGHAEVVKILLENGTHVNLQNNT